MKATQLLPLILGLAAARPADVLMPTSAAAPACPASVVDGDIAPYTMVHVTQQDPDKQHGTTTTGAIKPKDMCTWFAFNTPTNKPDSLCVLSFIFPNSTQMSRFQKYEYTGPGNFEVRAFYNLYGDDNDFSSGMTWTTQPTPPANTSAIYDYSLKFQPDGLYTINAGPCSQSKKSNNQAQLFVRICSKDTTFVFPESTKASEAMPQCATGLYVLVFPKSRTSPLPSPSPANPPSGGVGA